MQRPRAIVTLVAMASYSLFGALGLSDVVLCIGEHGHVAIEAASEGRCADLQFAAAASPARAALHKTIPAHTHCGDCVDIALAISDHEQRQADVVTSVAPLVLPMLVTSVSAPHLAHHDTSQLGLRWAQAPPFGYLAELRTIVMSC